MWANETAQQVNCLPCSPEFDLWNLWKGGRRKLIPPSSPPYAHHDNALPHNDGNINE